MELRKPSLSAWWLDQLNEKMEKRFPDIIGSGYLVDAWKIYGFNNSTTTLVGVYQSGVQYKMCSLPDYGEPESNTVYPKFEHTGWVTPEELNEE